MRKSLMALVLVFLSTALYAAKQSPDGPLPAADDYTVLAGKVTIGTIDAHSIGVLVDDGGGYRHIFRLWMEASVKTFRATSQSASVEFRGDELVVMAADQEWFYSLVTSSAGRAPRQPIGFTGANYVGYGLNHEIRPVVAKRAGSGRHVVALDSCDDLDTCIFNADFGSAGGGTGGGSCNSGGIGSTSCSTSNSYGSCSVSCSSGYACCTSATSIGNASCRCIQ